MKRLSLLLVFALFAAWTSPTLAAGAVDDIFKLGGDRAFEPAEVSATKAMQEFAEGWKLFAHPKFLLPLLAALVLAAVLAATIAYHPKSYRKLGSVAELEQPKTFILYAVVGAMVAKVVALNPAMAMVVFGIGGLMRFRTDVGAAKDTGRVILVTVAGLACGLNFFTLAIVGTAFGWILIYMLEARVVFKITAKGLESEQINVAAQAYREALTALGGQIIRERKNFVKGQASFLFRAPGSFNRDDLEERLEKDIPRELAGAVDWDTT
jgi:hypothetical protein